MAPKVVCWRPMYDPSGHDLLRDAGAEVKVVDIDHAKRRVTLETNCAVDGKKVLIGEAKVLAPSRKFD